MREPRTGPWRSKRLIGAAAAAFVLVLGAPAAAQLLGGGLSAPSLPLPAIGGVAGQPLAEARRLSDDANDLADTRLARLNELVRLNPDVLDLDPAGQPVVRGEVLAVSPTPQSLQIARRAGFAVARETQLTALDLDLVVLAAPAGLATRAAVERLRRIDPGGRYDFDHLYDPSGGAAASAPRSASGEADADTATRLGLIDGGVAIGHPAFAGSKIDQRGFAPGGFRSSAHGTAVASLMVGRAADFRGAAPGAQLFAADVYGAGPTGGSADAIVRALSWMAENRVPVVNVSLVGPANLTLEAAVAALEARGALIVAPVGNDGPAAPAQYPAAYPGVIAVTAVDGRGRLLPEDGYAKHVDFAAPGAGIRAAAPGGGYAAVRGTSFAAPVVSARLGRLLHAPDKAEALRAVAALAVQARAPGGGRGKGVVDAEGGEQPIARR